VLRTTKITLEYPTDPLNSLCSPAPFFGLSLDIVTTPVHAEDNSLPASTCTFVLHHFVPFTMEPARIGHEDRLWSHGSRRSEPLAGTGIVEVRNSSESHGLVEKVHPTIVRNSKPIKSKKSGKRPRVAQSCSECTRRKIKCDKK
jgi:hypothetical protein